jgi:aminopeptidase N
VTLSQKRFFLRTPADAAAQVGRWSVPLQLRAGAHGRTHAVLLTKDGEAVAAGSCQEPLSADAGAIGYYRVQYDAATLAANTRAFDTLQDGDRIALLDDQWALVQSQAAPLSSYLALAENMGSDQDTRPWEQIIGALGVIEYDERGSRGHDAFAAFARSLVKPLAQRLGWDARAGETPDVQTLRRQLIENLGMWGDTDTIAEAQRRFAAFVKDQSTIAPDDQTMVLDVVGLHANAATFEQLHTLAKAATDDAARRRFYTALAGVRDPKLAEQVAIVALSPELPPQELQLRLAMIGALRQGHPQLGWQTFSSNVDLLMSPAGNLAPLFEAQFVPQFFWNSLPPDKMEAWIRAHVPAEMNDYIEKGMEGARFQYSQKQELVPAADAYLAGRRSHA